jgi:hypothetical protein
MCEFFFLLVRSLIFGFYFDLLICFSSSLMIPIVLTRSTLQAKIRGCSEDEARLKEKLRLIQGRGATVCD